MKKLNGNQMEVLTGGVCELTNPNAHFPCRPNVCFGTSIAFNASGNTNIPSFVCIL